MTTSYLGHEADCFFEGDNNAVVVICVVTPWIASVIVTVDATQVKHILLIDCLPHVCRNPIPRYWLHPED